ncbi:MAG: hypothetical protein Q7S03_04050 [bacterium]|nr:hypothetical protein [bacterium]
MVGDQSFYFEIPDDSMVMVKVLEAIPPDWFLFKGLLEAPEALVSAGKAVKDNGFYVGRHYCIKPTVIRRSESRDRIEVPDLFAFIVERKLPEFVSFVELGNNSSEITLDQGKEIIKGLLKLGYRGSIWFVKDSLHNGCDIRLIPWKGPSAANEEAGKQPARIRVYRDKGEDVDMMPLVLSCRSLGLKVYEPVSS